MALKAVRSLNLIAFCALLAAAGCARGPFGGVGANVVRRLIVRVTFQGPIDDRLFYFVAFDDDDDQTDGPLPVVSAPFGNGWGTGTFTIFARYHQGIYQVFSHLVDPGGNVFESVLDRPFASVPPQGNVIEFTLDIDRLFAAGVRNLDVNIFATDQILVDPNLQAIKQEDGLGFPPGSDYITIPIDRNGIYENSSIQLEQAGDIVNQNLDITDFRIEVQQG